MKAYLGLLALSTCAIAGDWLTYGHDPQRTSWAFEETKIAPDSVSKMALAWKTLARRRGSGLACMPNVRVSVDPEMAFSYQKMSVFYQKQHFFYH